MISLNDVIVCGELIHRAFGRVEQPRSCGLRFGPVSSPNASLTRLASFDTSSPACASERLAAANSFFQVAQLAERIERVGIDAALEDRAVGNGLRAGRRSAAHEIDRRVAQHGRANMRLVVGIQRPIAVDFGV